MIFAGVHCEAPRHFSATPQTAAIHSVCFQPPNRPAAVRVNVAGHYATVLVPDAIMEGSRVGRPILVERFHFGWQALALLYSQCDLQQFHLGAAVEARLMEKMPLPVQRREQCAPVADRGDPRDIEAIRLLMRGPLIPWVHIAGPWALGYWYGAGGGVTLYRKAGMQWQVIESTGGWLRASELRAFGVPDRYVDDLL